MSTFKRYIGDSVYVDFDGYHVVLYTDNGYGKGNVIYLEPKVLDEFYGYVSDLNKKLEKERSDVHVK